MQDGRHRGFRLHRNEPGPTSATPRFSHRGVARNGAHGRFLHARFFHARFLALAILLAWASAEKVGAVDAPRLRELIRTAHLVGVGRVTAVEDFDHGRIRVYDLSIEKVLKPGNDEKPRTVRAVSVTDQPGAVAAREGHGGVAFLEPLRRNSYLDAHVGDTGGMFAFVNDRDGWIEAAESRELPSIVAPVEMVVRNSRKPPKGTARRESSRALAFALLSAPHPLLTDDGISSLSEIPGLSKSLTETEAGILTSTLHDPALPISARQKLIEEIAALNLRQMVDSLRDVHEPALQQDAWTALRRLGAPVSEEDLKERLAAEAPQTRLAAARELLQRDPQTAIPLVAGKLLRDQDEEVRLGTIEALGETKSALAVPPLEITFSGTDTTERQAAARALREIGGDAAADALHRLAFTGPIDSQRYAVVVLLASGVDRDDPRVRDIAARHTDEKIEAMLGDGIEIGHHH